MNARKAGTQVRTSVPLGEDAAARFTARVASRIRLVASGMLFLGGAAVAARLAISGRWDLGALTGAVTIAAALAILLERRR